MFAYLSLCKIDCVIRKAEQSAPSRRVDQPSKVGQAGTMAVPNRKAKPHFTLRVDHTRKLGNRAQTLTIKKELSKQSGLIVESLTEAGTVILQQDGKDLESLPLYAATIHADNFAQEHKEWILCLVLNKQEAWVKVVASLLGATRCKSEVYLIGIRSGQIRFRKVPKVKGGSCL
jgi:hypothetical protein